MKSVKIIIAIIGALIAWYIGGTIGIAIGADDLGATLDVCTMGAFIIAFCDKDK